MSRILRTMLLRALIAPIVAASASADPPPASAPAGPDVVDATSLRGKVLCGYQGWFRCPGDAAKMGWVHWSRDGRRLAPDTLTFEMWPDMSEYSAAERFPAPGFTYPDGRQAELFSSDNAATVQRHFDWMHRYGLDGVWLQHFVVDLRGGPLERRYASRLRVLEHVRAAATKTGRAWAITYDISGMSGDRIFDTLTADWKRLVDDKVTQDGRYLHQGGRPAVQVWGYYQNSRQCAMTAELAGRLLEFFQAAGPYSAFLVGGGDWNWRRNGDPAWQGAYRRFGAYAPWNVGNYARDASGARRASTATWAEDRRECERAGMMWIPVVYPGFSWDNLKRLRPGASTLDRRGGRFLWEQFHELSGHRPDGVFVAMFDEVDEGTAIFKVTSSPPTQGRFVGYDGLPSDWYLRLAGEATRLLREKKEIPADIPIKP